jgi:hypothetical protein
MYDLRSNLRFRDREENLFPLLSPVLHFQKFLQNSLLEQRIFTAAALASVLL